MGQCATVSIDCAGDFVRFMRDELAAMNIPLSPTVSPDEVFITFYDAKNRRLSPKQRKFFAAPTLAVPPEHEAGFDLLKAKVEAGDDLSPHLSLRIESSDKPDGLLIDWGIYHFHLGTTPHKKAPNFMARTGPLLYARVTSDAFYAIAVVDHGSWTNKDLLEQLHAHFPESLEEFRMEGIVGLEHNNSEDDHALLRENGIVGFVSLEDGTVLMPPGLGFTSNGRTSVQATLWMHKARRMLGAYQRHVEGLADRLAADISAAMLAQGKATHDHYQLKFGVLGDSACAFEEESNTCFELGPIP